MNCMYCSGNMERGIVPFHTYRKGYHITLERIPAWVCAQCGEVYFDQPEVKSCVLWISGQKRWLNPLKDKTSTTCTKRITPEI